MLIVINKCGVKTVTYTGMYMNRCGPGNSVGMATDYGLDGPGSNAFSDVFKSVFSGRVVQYARTGLSSIISTLG